MLVAALLCLLLADATPPAMPLREIRPPTTAPAGLHRELVDSDGARFVLFVPAGVDPARQASWALRVHFHGAPWFAIDEHLRCGLDGPLVVFSPGEGSAIYQRHFEDRGRLSRWIGMVEAELFGAGPRPALSRIDITSFSAGYGAVREIVKDEAHRALIRRIILADSLYGAWAETAPGATSRPAAASIEPWAPFVRAAARGEKTFVLTHSMIRTLRYAGTVDCADALIEIAGARRVAVEAGSSPAAADERFPLVSRADLGGFHVWGYAGEDGPAHMTHARHIADVWRALDAASPRVPRPPIVGRDEWGSRPLPIPNSRRHVPRFVTLHHAGVLWKHDDDPVRFVRAMQSWGQRDKDWPDLPYHFLIAPDGRIFEGRPLEYEPESNTTYELAGNINVEMMGDFNQQRPTQRQLDAAVHVTAWLCATLDIAPSAIRGHADAAPGQTTCPGTDFERYLKSGEFRQWVEATIDGAAPAARPGDALPDGPTIPVDRPFPATAPATAPADR